MSDTEIPRRRGLNAATRTALLASVSVAAACTAALPAMAQSSSTADTEQAAPPVAAPPNDAAAPAQNEAEDIVVVGLRGSLQRNLDIKRTAPGVVDVISSEDIGKFPDSNVAASLQRLPGVSIQRSGARGEPTGITVRGFGGDFNETLYDGRRLSTATGNRAVDFSTIGADFVGQLNVLKTPDVSLSSSSIGATVNVQFPKPFDRPGFHAAVTGSGSVQDRAGRIVPAAGFLVSDTFANDTMGILADAFYTRRDTRSNRVFVSGWAGGFYAPCQLAGSTATTCAPTSDRTSPGFATPSNRQNITGWFPQQYGAEQDYVKDERVDARIALQWHPSDDLMVTLDNNFSQQEINNSQALFGVWFNQGDLRNVQLDANGTTTDFKQAGTATDYYSALQRSINRTNQTGLNAKWDATPELQVEADASYSKSWLNPGLSVSSDNADIGYGGTIGPNLGLRITGDSKNSFPEMNSFGPNDNQARWIDPAIMGSHVIVRGLQQNTDAIKQGRLQATWKKDDFSIRVGGQYLEDQYRLRASDTFANNFWQAYAGYGPASGRTTGLAIPPSLVNGTIGLDNFIPGFSGNLPPSLIRFDYRTIQNFLSALGNPQAKNVPSFNYGGSNVGTAFAGAFDLAPNVGASQDVRERTVSGYFRVNFSHEIAGMPFWFNAGARYEATSVSSSGIGRLPLSIIASPADPTLLTIATYTPAATITTKSSYAYLLPSFDMKLEVTDKLLLRFDASRTLTRPSVSLLTPVLNVPSNQRVGAFTASGGNPALRPFLSDNFDLAAEWYYQRNSYVSINGFMKRVSDFVVSGVQRQPINSVIDPTTGVAAQFDVQSRFNGPTATIRGVELAWQQVFGDTGFGFNANATFVSSNRPYDNRDTTQTGFAVTGLANSANFVGFYDKNGFQIRGALNWRDKYLLQFGQNQNTGAFGAEPTFVNQALQIDMSTSYDINPRFSVFGEVLNVNNTNYSTHGRFSNQLLDVFNYGRRYTAGIRFRY